MGSKNILYKKQLINKKMLSIVFYGLLFLIATMTYYFVNVSKGQDVLDLTVNVKDANGLAEKISYEMKVNSNEGKYYAIFPKTQNGREIEKYILITEQEFNETSDEENIDIILENTDVEDKNDEEKSANETKSDENVVQENSEKSNQINDEEETKSNNTKEVTKTDDNEEQVEKDENTNLDIEAETAEEEQQEILPGEELELTQEQINSQNVYIMAVYKQVDTETLGVGELEENQDMIESQKEIRSRIDEELNAQAALTKAGEPLRAAANVLVIDDYDSDYNYYKGKNFTDDFSGIDRDTYTDSNLVEVTINYHGYALADEANDSMKGKISLDTNERQDTVQYIKCVPIQNGRVTVELMDNPFMDKPTGYGFGGWTSTDGTITTNSNTNAQTISVTTSTDVEIDVYTNWATATVIYLNGANGNDNRNGLTAGNAVKTWTSAVSKLSNTTNRELNIIVICGNMYDGINYQGGGSSSNTTNSNYSSASNSKALTVTSLYNHTDYRDQATLNLSSNATRGTFILYKDFQINHVKINATGYTYSNNTGAGINTGGPRLIGYCHNVRIGRGMTQSSTATDSVTFTAAVGGNATSNTTSSTAAYRFVVESGKYHMIIGTNYYNGNGYNYAGTTYLILGSDVDRASGHIDNESLSVYYRTTVNSGDGYNGTSGNDMSFLIDVKSGKFGVDFFETNGDTDSSNGYTAGIYVGGFGAQVSSTNTDRAPRYCIVEGGQICNLIGGIKMYTSYAANAKTRLYVKGGEIYNIVGGAGRSTTYGDRLIQVTGGKILYSISGGSNGVYSSSGEGQISNCNTLVYIGGDAQIGTNATISETLYAVEGGCVLGAGNGKQGTDGCGQVDNSHIVINDNAHILNNVFGGGNYGVVGASNSSSATAVIDILGGTIDGNVYGGSNQNNINGSTRINVKGGQIKGTVYGGSNSSGTIKSSSRIDVTGGTLGTTGNTDAVLFGGGKGQTTFVNGGTTVNILDTDGNVNIYGTVYGGSEQGVIGSGTVSVSYSGATPSTSSITSGNSYIISSGTSTTSYALIPNGTSVTRNQLSSTTPPGSTSRWIITAVRFRKLYYTE